MFKKGSTIILVPLLLASMPFSSYYAMAQEDVDERVKVLKTVGYLDKGNRYIIFGEVMNTGGPLQFLDVVADFFDEDRNLITSVTSAVDLERLNTDQVSPFSIILNEQSTALMVKTFSVQIGSFHNAEEKPRKLDIVFHELEKSPEGITLNGRAVNDGTAVSENTRILVTVYDAVGDLLRITSTYTEPRNILPQSGGKFSLQIKIQDAGSIGGYAINIESSQYAEEKRVLELEAPAVMEKLEETVILNDLLAVNVSNEPVNSVRVGTPVVIKTILTSSALERQEYTYILQIKHEAGHVVSISWRVDHLDVEETSEASIAWIPVEPGTYMVEVFVWKNLEEAVPLSFKTLSRMLRAG